MRRQVAALKTTMRTWTVRVSVETESRESCDNIRAFFLEERQKHFLEEYSEDTVEMQSVGQHSVSGERRSEELRCVDFSVSGSATRLMSVSCFGSLRF